jgi:hypothetical protein
MQKPNSQISPNEQSVSFEQFGGGIGKHVPTTHCVPKGHSLLDWQPFGVSQTLLLQTMPGSGQSLSD